MTERKAKEIKQQAAQEADRKSLTGTRRDAYIYGTLRNAGWQPKKKRGK